ncbi:hypothetical protein X777_06166 [Ooceraea biroi]|uniref:Uncharacterized protein n=3 Tax=Ooceraea biroi TaxID=2015173 RepID=A0A026WF30_OOCBI|nr:hypothetical protein X777_06166 [Ooceraea biroi]
MNVNARDVAKELWKLMKTRLNNGTSNFISEENIIEDLENAVKPFVSPTRRGMSQLHAYQVATDLDQIIRTAYIRNFPNMNMLDIEIATRNIAANMMAMLKVLLSKNLVRSQSDEMGLSGRRMIYASPNDDKQNDYVDIKIKIRREDILNAVQ